MQSEWKETRKDLQISRQLHRDSNCLNFENNTTTTKREK